MRAAPGAADGVGHASGPRVLCTPRAEAQRPILVLGIGNLLMGDEGIGVHAIRHLERGERLPSDVRVVDGGTGGFHLLSYLDEHDTVVMIDATLDGRPPGTLSWIAPRHAADFPRSLTAHDIGLRDLVESAALLGRLPTIHLLTVSVAGLQPMQTSLTPALEAALPRVVDQVVEFVRALRIWEVSRLPLTVNESEAGQGATVPRCLGSALASEASRRGRVGVTRRWESPDP